MGTERTMMNGIVWRKSSYSAANGGCVEVAHTPREVRVRDTKDRTGGTLTLGAREWQAFLRSV